MERGQNESLQILIFHDRQLAARLRAAGNEVLSAGFSEVEHDLVLPSPGIHIAQILDAIKGSFLPNRLVYVDDEGPLSVVGLEDCALPSLFWSLAGKRHVAWHKYASLLFDCTVVSDKILVEQFAELGAHVRYLAPAPATMDCRALVEVIRGLRRCAHANKHFGAGSAYLASSELCRETLPEVAELFLVESANNLIASAARGETPDARHEPTILVCKTWLDEIGLYEQAYLLSKAAHDRYPQSKLLTYLYVETLVNAGVDGASLVALLEPFTGRPDALLHVVPSFLDALRAILLGKEDVEDSALPAH